MTWNEILVSFSFLNFPPTHCVSAWAYSPQTESVPPSQYLRVCVCDGTLHHSLLCSRVFLAPFPLLLQHSHFCITHTYTHTQTPRYFENLLLSSICVIYAQALCISHAQFISVVWCCTAHAFCSHTPLLQGVHCQQCANHASCATSMTFLHNDLITHLTIPFKPRYWHTHTHS